MMASDRFWAVRFQIFRFGGALAKKAQRNIEASLSRTGYNDAL